MPKFLPALFSLLLAVPCARGENWPGWRGTDGSGVSNETHLPTRWGTDENIVWKAPIPGRGHSSPIIWEDDVFVTSCVESEEKRILLCLDRRTGETKWERTVLEAPLEEHHRLNSFASSTPATDGKQVFVTFLDRDQMYVAAYDFQGNKQWEQRPGEFHSKHGFCTCPVLYKDNVILNGDHDGDAYIVMIRKSDGKTVWKTPRENKLRSYCTPIILNVDGQDQLVLNGSMCTTGYDVQTGKLVWICDGPSEQMVATVVHGHGLIFSLGGYPQRHLLAIRKGGQGDVTASHIAWRTHKSIPYVPSPLLYGDWLHVVADEGIYTCFEPKTGEVMQQKRVSKHISSSLVGADGKVYITDDRGTTTVVANNAKYQVLARNEVGEEVYSTPAISQGNLFIRGTDHLFCIGETDAPRASQ